MAADFRNFTIAASVITIVLGAGVGAAFGALSGPPPPAARSQQAPMSASTPRSMPQAGSAMGAGMADQGGRGARHAGQAMMGNGALTGPGTQRLHSMPTGTVRVGRDMQGMLQIQLDLYGLTPGSPHIVSIDGPHSTAVAPEVRFPTFFADATGRANAMLTALSKTGALQAGSRVSFRLGSYPAGGAMADPAAAELIAQSAVLPAHPVGQQSAVIPRSYGAAGNYQGRLHGWARLAYTAGARALSVTVTAFGLPPGAHAAHLHLGSCQDQGAVKYMLMDFVANANGDIVDQTRTVTGVTAPPPSGWYLNLHLGASSAIVAHGMPTLSFRPELCANVTSVQMAGH